MSLATVDFASSLTWAMLIGWIMSVVLHELGHGVVGYLGGDYTLRERGGLTLNPLQYIDPIFSILVPALIFIVGGVPLPGGVTYIHMELIPRRIWQSAVSAAGPFVNFLIFLGCALPFHPKLHLIDPQPVDGQWSNAILFLGAFVWLQLLAMFFNLVPIPGLDGFGIIRPYLPRETREKLASPQLRRTLFFVWFALIWQVPQVMYFFYRLIIRTLLLMGFGVAQVRFFGHCYDAVLFGEPM